MLAMILAKDVAATTENVRKPVTENVLVGGAESHSGFGVTTERYDIYLDLSNLLHGMKKKAQAVNI